jgi:hypothetical protein
MRRLTDAVFLFCEGAAYVLLALWLVCLGTANPAWLHGMAMEDGVIENLSALFWLLGFALCLQYLFRGGRRRFVMILFCAVCFVCLGEEISWGQRIFQLKTPDILLDLNMQKELNIHNFRAFGLSVAEQSSWHTYFQTGKFNPRMILNPFFFFRVFVVTYFFLFPLAALWRRGSRFLSRIGYYPPKPYFIILFFIAIVITRQLGLPGMRDPQSAGETQEMCYALFIAIYTLHVSRSSGGLRVKE